MITDVVPLVSSGWGEHISMPEGQWKRMLFFPEGVTSASQGHAALTW